MKISTLLNLSKTFIISKQNTVKLRNVLLGVSIAMIPLILVLIVSEGMIFGITQRFIEIGSYPFLQILCLSDVNNITLSIQVLVNSRFFR